MVTWGDDAKAFRPVWKSNPEPSFCEARVLTTLPPCSHGYTSLVSLYLSVTL